jgi:chorismate lyase
MSLRLPLRALIREVHLLCDDRPWVFARTIIPISTLRGRERRLAQSVRSVRCCSPTRT